MGRRERAVQAFCRRQNLGAGGIHFRRAWKKRRRRTISPRRSGTEREGVAGYGVSGPFLHRRGRRPRRPTAGASPRPTGSCSFVVPDDAAGAGFGRAEVAAQAKKASPFQGEAVERSETDEGAHGDNGRPSLRPLIRPCGPPSPQGEGPARRVVAPYGETGAISPPVSLRSTAPSSEGAKEKASL